LSTPPEPLLIAHRGLTSVALENSLAAFRGVVDNRDLAIDGVELDVHSTADGRIVVHHDAILAGGRVIAELTSAQVMSETLPDGSAIPTLEEALSVLGTLRVYVEAKTLMPEADEELLRILREGPHPAGYQVHSFDHRIIARLQAEADDFRFGVLSSSWPVDPVSPVWAAGAEVLWQHWPLIDFELMERCRDRSIDVIAWTVPRDQVAAMAELGVTGVCMNL
jgi:glycerophosphoryl diester phosphodiesterase